MQAAACVGAGVLGMSHKELVGFAMCWWDVWTRTEAKTCIQERKVS